MKKSLFRSVSVLFCLVILAVSSFPYTAKEVETNISQAIKSYLTEKEPEFADAKINVTYKYVGKMFSGLADRRGKIKFEVAELYPGFKPIGNIIVPIQVMIDDVPKDKIFLRTNVEVIKNAVVANRPLKKGEVITGKDVDVKQMDISRVYTKVYFKSTEEVMGKEVKTYIPRDFVVIDWMIAERSLVRRKDKVRMKTVVGDVMVYGDGESLEDGPAGGKIKVRNIRSNKVVIGTVTGTNEVTVDVL